MSRNVVETIMGAVVLTVGIGFGYFAYKSSDIEPRNGYEVTAKFESVDGLSLGSEVRLGGIKVGTVSNLMLEPETYEAVATLHLKEEIKVPKDSTAAVVSDGLLGNKFVALTPGAEDQMLADGGEISYTQSSVNLEALIGKFMFSGGGVDKEEEKPESSAAPSVNSGVPGLGL